MKTLNLISRFAKRGTTRIILSAAVLTFAGCGTKSAVKVAEAGASSEQGFLCYIK